LEAALIQEIERDCAEGKFGKARVQSLLGEQHEAFKRALDSKAIGVGSWHEPKLLDQFGTNAESIFDSVMTFVQPVGWLVFALAALFTKQWWLLMGIPATWFGMVLRIGILRFLPLFQPFRMGVVTGCIVWAVVLLAKGEVLGWILVGFLTGYFAEDSARYNFRLVIESRIYESAACFAYLQLKGVVWFIETGTRRVLPQFDSKPFPAVGKTMATAHREQERDSQTQEGLEKVSARMETIEAYEKRWREHAELKHWAEALTIADGMIAAWPDRSLGFARKAYCLDEVRRTAEAKATLLPIVDRFPKDYYIRVLLACYECSLGNLAWAKVWLKRTQSIAGTEAVQKLTLGDSDLVSLQDYIRSGKW
jgi:hypothetical protein